LHSKRVGFSPASRNVARSSSGTVNVLDLEPVTSVILGAPDRGLNRAVLLGLWVGSPLSAVWSGHSLKVGRDLVYGRVRIRRGHLLLLFRGAAPCLAGRRRQAAALQGASRGATQPANAFPLIHARRSFGGDTTRHGVVSFAFRFRLGALPQPVPLPKSPDAGHDNAPSPLRRRLCKNSIDS